MVPTDDDLPEDKTDPTDPNKALRELVSGLKWDGHIPLQQWTHGFQESQVLLMRGLQFMQGLRGVEPHIAVLTLATIANMQIDHNVEHGTLSDVLVEECERAWDAYRDTADEFVSLNTTKGWEKDDKSSDSR